MTGRRPLLFNPREASDAELEETFVARQGLLNEILRGLREARSTPIPLLEEAMEVRRSPSAIAKLASLHPEVREAVERFLTTQAWAEQGQAPLLAAEPRR